MASQALSWNGKLAFERHGNGRASCEARPLRAERADSLVRCPGGYRIGRKTSCQRGVDRWVVECVRGVGLVSPVRIAIVRLRLLGHAGIRRGNRRDQEALPRIDDGVAGLLGALADLE